MTVITRFPPSPTGFVHIGSLRTALYNYIVARQNKGKFIIRIEDTDQERKIEGAVENLLKTLQWAGIDYDEGPYYAKTGKLEEKGESGPYIQSQRTQIYRDYAEKLLKNGHAYRCFCTKERLNDMRKKQQEKKLPPMYDQKCRNLSEDEIQKKLKDSFVIRQKLPEGQIMFTDIIRGEMRFDTKTLDDHVLMKSDGFPTYHLANVIDDHLMGITHVIRGEEWLPSTPKHVLLYQAFGWNLPIFGHLPLLLNPDKSKLSKRQGDVAVEDYIKKGYLPEALINFIALLGWHPKEDEEIFSLTDLIEKFDIHKVQKAGAICNFEKLDFLNGHYLRELSLKDLKEKMMPLLESENWYTNHPCEDRFLKLIQSRMKTLNEGIEMLKIFYVENFNYNQKLFEHQKMKIDKKIAKKSLEEAVDFLKTAAIDYENEESVKEHLVSLIEKLGIKSGQLLWPIRVALTNEPYSPGVFELIWALGKETTIKRIKAAAEKLQ